MYKSLQEELLLSTSSQRHGIVLRAQTARTGLSDIRGIWHTGVPQNTRDPWKSAAGGAARSERKSKLSAIGEGLERYAGAIATLPLKKRSDLSAGEYIPPEDFSLFSEEQRSRPDFPFENLYKTDAMFTNVYSVFDNREYWVPHGLVSLRDDYATGVSTSSGLAAGPTKYAALLRAIQEIIERDALMITWLHGVPGRQVQLPSSYTDEVVQKSGTVFCFDATPAYSPHPVAIVAGTLPIRGFPRHSLGSACRETWEEAVEKAYLEWCQGIFFTGYYYSLHPNLHFESYEDVNTFDSHAIYYTVYPEKWKTIPLLHGEPYRRSRTEKKSKTDAESLTKLAAALDKHKVRILYRDITTPDLAQIGTHVVRALSPDFAPIFSHQRFPFLGGTVKDCLRRYPWVAKYHLTFPNPMPHPLG